MLLPWRPLARSPRQSRPARQLRSSLVERDWLDYVTLLAEVLAAFGTTVAALIAAVTVVRARRERQADVREHRLGDVVRTLLQMRATAPTSPFGSGEFGAGMHQLAIQEAALDPRDREQVPAVRELIRGFSATKLSEALSQLAIWRGEHRNT